MPKIFLILTLMFCLAVNASFAEADDEIDVITHNSVVENSLSTYELYSIFTRKSKTWDNGDPITLVLLNPDDKLHRKFINSVIGMTTLHFNKLMEDESGKYLRIVANQETAMYIISDVPGAVGYAEGIVYSNNSNDVKHIHIVY